VRSTVLRHVVPFALLVALPDHARAPARACERIQPRSHGESFISTCRPRRADFARWGGTRRDHHDGERGISNAARARVPADGAHRNYEGPVAPNREVNGSPIMRRPPPPHGADDQQAPRWTGR
jgi:hypothetical protein